MGLEEGGVEPEPVPLQEGEFGRDTGCVCALYHSPMTQGTAHLNVLIKAS